MLNKRDVNRPFYVKIYTFYVTILKYILFLLNSVHKLMFDLHVDDL